MNITIKQDALVVLVGAMGTGKSTFARNHFATHHIVESDYIREQLTGDFENQDYNSAVFEILFATVESRAKAGILTVIDSTGNQSVLDRIAVMANTYDRPLVMIKFPELAAEEITEERFKHRWKYKKVYNRQVARIARQEYHKLYDQYHLTDVDATSVEYERYSDAHQLDSNYSYVIIPDLHGEYKVLEEYIERYKDDDTVRFISLGDIVDRGESSYKTFNLLFDLIADGKADAVVSNHDNKFYRWLKKWWDDDADDKYLSFYKEHAKYGMSIAHGLDNTIDEFFTLNPEEMDTYAVRFINYYETNHHYLFVEKDNGIHYFTHAGISSGIARGNKLNKRDTSAVLYETISDPEVLTDIFKHVEKDVHLHVGHDYNSDDITFHPNENGTRWIVKHDIGLGKITVDIAPKFMVLK